jgi:hypothetical protein
VKQQGTGQQQQQQHFFYNTNSTIKWVSECPIILEEPFNHYRLHSKTTSANQQNIGTIMT